MQLILNSISIFDTKVKNFKTMRSQQSLLKEIIQLTISIENNFPELYQKLHENPITIPYESSPKINYAVFQDYLESLKKLLRDQLEEHPMG
jgi:hypothetical protein